MAKWNLYIGPLLAFCCWLFTWTQSGSADVYKSPESNFTRIVGESIKFRCEGDFDGAENLALWWFHDIDLISIEETLFSVNLRYREHRVNLTKLIDDETQQWVFELTITDLELSDEGVYRCQIQPGVNEKKYFLVVNAPPVVTVDSIPKVDLSEGEGHVLPCSAIGKPTPRLKWTRNGEVLQETDGTDDNEISLTLALDSLTKRDSGNYTCTADSGVLAPVSKTVVIKVHFQPMVGVEESLVHSAPGFNASLTCHFVASEQLFDTFSWRFDDKDILQGDSRFSYEVEVESRGGDDRSGELVESRTLHLIGVRRSDFGSYVCSGENHFGKASAQIYLTGRPTELTILSSTQSQFATKYPLVWRVHSLSNISHFEIRAEEENSNSVENELVVNMSVPIADEQIRPYHQQHLLLLDLRPNSVYSFTMRARNEFGYSDWLHPLTISTPQEDLPETTPSQTSKSTAQENKLDKDVRIAAALGASGTSIHTRILSFLITSLATCQWLTA